MTDQDETRNESQTALEDLVGDTFEPKGLEVWFHQDANDLEDDPDHVGAGLIFSGKGTSFVRTEGSGKFEITPELSTIIKKDLGIANRNDDWRTILKEDELFRFDEDARRLARGEKDAIHLNISVRSNGIPVRADFYLFVIERDSDGRPVAAIGWYQYVSQEKQFEQQLMDLATNIYSVLEYFNSEGIGSSITGSSNADYLAKPSFADADLSWLNALVWAGQSIADDEEELLWFVKDRSMRYADISPAAAKVFGMTPAEMIGKADSELFDEPDRETEAEIQKTLLSGGRVRILDHGKSGALPKYFVQSLRSVPDQDPADARLILGLITPIEKDRKPYKPESRKTAMQKVREKALQVAQYNSTVVLYGESGSGKTELARIIHKHSGRPKDAFVILNCATISPSLVESELFGHEKGAFTGAIQQKRGKLELSDGGTLLLDEIDKMSLDMQAKLLTFLDGNGFQRVGGQETLRPNVRILAATNKDLEELVRQDLFLEDLYYRLNVVLIRVPPLRDRQDEIQDLVDNIVADLFQRLNLPRRPTIGKQEIGLIKSYQWPGNIRELRNVLERALVLSPAGKLSLWEAMPKQLFQADEFDGSKSARGPVGHKWFLAGEFRKNKSEGSLLEYAERSLIEQALEKANGIKKEAARFLGITWPSLKPRLKRLGILGSK